jgi:hypothetical protein
MNPMVKESPKDVRTMKIPKLTNPKIISSYTRQNKYKDEIQLCQREGEAYFVQLLKYFLHYGSLDDFFKPLQCYLL